MESKGKPNTIAGVPLTQTPKGFLVFAAFAASENRSMRSEPTRRRGSKARNNLRSVLLLVDNEIVAQV
jgi:hypothetical protein